MNITIDGISVKITAEDRNIVDVASRAGIAIPAPCYRSGRKQGCCKGCVVEIDGEQKFACCTKPEDGMNVIVKRDDLKALNKMNLIVYQEAVKSGKPLECDCDCSEGDCC